jgi:nitrite reductase/ring-hydroxylating ferredoxin subunit
VIDALLARAAEGLDQGQLPVELFGDAELYQRELASIFGRCWLFVGHESEIATPGDFVARRIGEDEVLLVRSDQGKVNVLLNHCRHRGTQLCRADRGRQRQFRCPYHFWTYDTEGRLVGAPYQDRAYRSLDREAWSLWRAPHVDSYRGLIFASADPQAVPLREYLGDMTWYLDVAFGVAPGGMRVVGAPHRWLVSADWKSAAENFAGDAYHVPALHRSAEKVGVVPDIGKAVTGQIHVDLESGHGLLVARKQLPEPWGLLSHPPEVADAVFDTGPLTPAQQAFVRDYTVTTFTVFPNFSFIRVPGQTDRAGTPPTIYTLLRQWQPRGPGLMEVWSWVLSWTDAPDWFREMSIDASLANFGPAGYLEQDDAMAWAGAATVARSALARKARITFNYQLGLGEMSDYPRLGDWVGPGQAYATVLGEAPQRSFYRRWLREVRHTACDAAGEVAR